MILVKSKSGMRMVDRKGQKGFLELDEPVWASDDHFRACPACNSMFDMFKRKHHCRRCGGVFCGDCATDKVIPRRLRFIDPVKMCGKCQKVSKWENDFFENYQKKLKSGLELNVETEKDNKVDRGLATVTLVEDGSVIEITSESGPYMPILMNEVSFFFSYFYNCLQFYINSQFTPVAHGISVCISTDIKKFPKVFSFYIFVLYYTPISAPFGRILAKGE